jgi:pimeloyl-ACP methyl ester carboxylesterase
MPVLAFVTVRRPSEPKLDPTLRVRAHRGIGPLALSLPFPLFIYRRLLAQLLGRHAVDRARSELIHALRAATRRRGFAHTVSTFLREELRGMEDRSVGYNLGERELARLRRPALVIWGDTDDHYQPVDQGRRRTACMPGARFELVHGGHAASLDDADVVGRLVRDFVSGRRGRCA